MGVGSGLRARWEYPVEKGLRVRATAHHGPSQPDHTHGASVSRVTPRSGQQATPQPAAGVIGPEPTSGSDALPARAPRSHAAAGRLSAEAGGSMGSCRLPGRDRTGRLDAAGIGRCPDRASRACPERHSRSTSPQQGRGLAAADGKRAWWTHRGLTAGGRRGRECRAALPGPPRAVSQAISPADGRRLTAVARAAGPGEWGRQPWPKAPACQSPPAAARTCPA